MRCGAGMTTLDVAVALWQSAEKRCRELEAADAASVARLVRGVCCCGGTLERVVVVFGLVMCMLLWWWHGQAGAGLRELRAPAVRNPSFSLVVVVVWLWRVCRVAVAVHALRLFSGDSPFALVSKL